MRDYGICCAKSSPVPPQFSCMCIEIGENYNKLCQRYNKVTAKCQHTRIGELAEPKCIEPKYKEKRFCPNVVFSKVQLIDKTDQMAKTRTEQLALPKPRNISILKQHQSFDTFSDNRKSDINRTLRKSLLSVYSRLMNVKLDQNKSKSKKITQNVKNKLMEKIEILSAPKKDYSLVKRRKSGDKDRTPTMQNIEKLSKPKTYKITEPNQWVLTDALKNYEPSERLLNISKPKKHNVHQHHGHVPIRRLTCHDMSRIKQLAKPIINNSMKAVKIENPFQTNPLALKAVASKRILNLASPRDYFDVHSRTNPFKVSSKALKAKTTARILKLAEPKRRYS